MDLTRLLLPPVIEALGLFADRELIDSMYDTDRRRYQEAAQSHELYNHYMFLNGDAQKAVYCHRILGMIASGVNVSSLIRKTWPKASRYVRSPKGLLNINDYAREIMPDTTDDDLFFALICVFIYLAYITGVEVDHESFDFNIIFGTLRDIEMRNQGRDPTEPSFASLSDKAIEEAERLLGDIGSKYGIQFNGAEAAEDTTLPFSEVNETIINSEKLNIHELASSLRQPLQRQDNIEVLAYLLGQRKGNPPKTTSAGMYLQAAIKLKVLSRAYQELKCDYLNGASDDLRLQIADLNDIVANLEERLQEQDIRAEQQRQTADTEIQRLREEYRSTLERTISDLEKEVLDLQALLSQEAEKQRELIALREHAYALSLDEQGSSAEEITEQELEFPAVRCIIVGGHDNWQTRLRQRLPDTFSFVSADTRSLDASSIRDASYVIINSSFLSHMLYNQVISGIGKDAVLGFVTSANLDLALREIHHVVTE